MLSVARRQCSSLCRPQPGLQVLPSALPALFGRRLQIRMAHYGFTGGSQFDFRGVESRVRQFWDQNKIYEKAKAQTNPKNKFYFVDGPPYTSGKVHLGTAWNKTLKDVITRVKRMQGFDVWDRPGYDMHGLPTEKATEKELGISTREQILALGTDKFVEYCRALCIRNMNDMTEVFKAMGVWMQWDDPYISIARDYMEGEWWLIKRVHELGRLYEGEKTMTWDSVNGTALAKHELYYSQVVDQAIYVRFPLLSKEPQWANTSVVIWTTTPWTIPFNLAVMVHPDITYCQVEIPNGYGGTECIVVAEARLKDFAQSKLKLQEGTYHIRRKFLGQELKGLHYSHPFSSVTSKYADLKHDMPSVHTVLTNSEYVTTDAGTGIVHVAPGCGPEDYVVGQQNGIKPFNAVNPEGVYEGFAPFDGLRARKDDRRFIDLIREQGAVVHEHSYEHDYPFGERSKEPVIYRTTKQWFFRVEDMKDKLLEEHEKIKWVPEAAGNSFRSWLENLRDNSISKQRFWGTPVPIWRNVDDSSDYIVVGSVQELVQLAGLREAPEDIHIPTVDKIEFSRISPKDGKEHVYRRVPDVLDVWVDAGTASFNSLRYPAKVGEDVLREWFPMSFILEGKDQIRGWFNLLHVLSVVVFGQRSFNACYMHGFINDSLGRKMSKSIGNYILPAEVTQKYGADVMRLYMTSGAAPALDLNYNFKDLDTKMKNTKVFWNLHKWVFDTAAAAEVEPMPIEAVLASPVFGLEERYVFSKLNSTIDAMTQYVSDTQYRLNEFPVPVESFLLEVLSHTYLQLTWEKASSGTDEEKAVTVSVVYHSLVQAMTLMAPVMPFFAEEVYQNLRNGFSGGIGATLYPEDSVHLRRWPSVQPSLLNPQLERDMDAARDAIAAILAGRDKISVGVKWPLQEVSVNVTLPGYLPSLQRCEPLILQRTGVKILNFHPLKVQVEVRPNSKVIGKQFGPRTQAVLAYIQNNSALLVDWVESGCQPPMSFADPSRPADFLTLTAEHVIVRRAPPENYVESSGQFLQVFLNTVRTPELDKEGFLREVTRRVQMLRKKLSLKRRDKVDLFVAVDKNSARLVYDAVVDGQSFISERAGVVKMHVVGSKADFVGVQADNISIEKVKQYDVVIGIIARQD